MIQTQVKQSLVVVNDISQPFRKVESNIKQMELKF